MITEVLLCKVYEKRLKEYRVMKLDKRWNSNGLQHLLNELNQASAFDLYCLHVAIGNELENPKRILHIKQKLRVDMDFSYFYHVEDRLVKRDCSR